MSTIWSRKYPSKIGRFTLGISSWQYTACSCLYGSGTSASSSNTAAYCNHLNHGSIIRFERYDILGEIKILLFGESTAVGIIERKGRNNQSRHKRPELREVGAHTIIDCIKVETS